MWYTSKNADDAGAAELDAAKRWQDGWDYGELVVSHGASVHHLDAQAERAYGVEFVAGAKARYRNA